MSFGMLPFHYDPVKTKEVNLAFSKVCLVSYFTVSKEQ